MNLKKLMSLLFVFALVVSLVFSLASCKKDEDGTTDKTQGGGTQGEVVIDLTGLKYEMKKDGTYKVIGYVLDEDFDDDGEPFVIEIPSVCEKARVTEIGDRAFENCDYIDEIVLPETISTIGKYAFAGCDGITAVSLPESVALIGDHAFYGCKNLVDVSVADYTDDDNIAYIRIGDYAFAGCVKLAGDEGEVAGSFELSLPERVESIGAYAFDGCTALTNITLPSTVSTIGEGAFYGCTELVNVDFAEGIELDTIAPLTFYGCESLVGKASDGSTVFAFPAGIKKIGYYAFKGCASLAAVSFPASVERVGSSAFDGCATLTKAYAANIVSFSSISFVDAKANPISQNAELFIDGALVEHLDLTGVTSVGDYAFYNYKSLKSVAFASSVKSIGDCAFANCTALDSLNTGDGVKSIGAFAFYGCTGLDDIVIGNAVASIGNGAFEACTGFANLTIPASVKSIGSRAFKGCSLVGSIVIPDSVTSVGAEAFKNCIAAASITIGEGVKTLGNGAFEGCTSVCSINFNAISMDDLKENNLVFASTGSGVALYIGQNVTKVPAYFAYSSTNNALLCDIVSVQFIEGGDIKSACKTIGDYAFKDMVKVSAISLCDALTSIGDGAFEGCVALGDIAVSESVTDIGAGAFKNCTAALSITIPASVKNIGDGAFEGCGNVSEINFNAASLNSLEAGNKVFSGLGNNVILNIGSEVAKIEPAMFSSCVGISTINVTSNEKFSSVGNCIVDVEAKTIIFGCKNSSIHADADVVTKIGAGAFEDCTALTLITIPDNITSIGAGAFKGCSALVTVSFGKGVEAIDYSMFEGCVALELFMMSDENAEYMALNNCIIEKSTKTIVLGCKTSIIPTDEAIATIIGEDAFKGCTGLVELTVPGNIATIKAGAFEGCTGLVDLVLSDGVTTVNDGAFKGCSALKSVWFGKNVLSIKYEIFEGCTALESLTVDSENASYKSVDNCVIDKMNQSIMLGCKTSIIPTDASVVKSIGARAFKDCEGIVNLVIPSNIKSIRASAFENCKDLETIYIPASVTTMNNNVFKGCDGLVISCEAEKAADTWANSWNSSGCEVIFGVAKP